MNASAPRPDPDDRLDDDLDGALDGALRVEITETLRADELDVFARADLAAEALDLAEAEALVDKPRERVWKHATTVVVAMAALVILLVGPWPQLLGVFRDHDEPTPSEEEEPFDPKGELRAGSVAAERDANVAFLADPKTQARIAAIPDGAWIGIQHGKTLLTSDDLGKLDMLLKRAERDGVEDVPLGARPHALHRFTFQKGSQGDRTYKTYFGKPPFVGAAFINKFMFHVSMGGGIIEYSHVKDGKRQGKPVIVNLQEGKGAELPIHIGEPTSLGGVEVAVGYSTGSTNPLVLPDGMGFPRFEIPGTASLEGGGGHRSFRRYVASVSIPRMTIREVFVEAMGRAAPLEQEDGSLRLGGVTWQPYGAKAIEAARKAGKPLLLLERQRWMNDFPGHPFAGLRDEQVRGMLEPFVLAWRELPDRSTWFGGEDEAPPAEARLSLLDPRRSETVLRYVVIRPWTRQRQIAQAIESGWRRYVAGPEKHIAAIEKNEAVAIGMLRDIHKAQQVAVRDVIIDVDKNGVGEYASLAELTGTDASRRRDRLKPLLPIRFRPKPEHQHTVVDPDIRSDLVWSGYRVRLFFPGHEKTRGVHRTPDGKRLDTYALGSSGGSYTTSPELRDHVDMAKAETHWWAYAWPEDLEVTGRRAFYIDQDGEIFAIEANAGGYAGRAMPPSPDAAFAERGRYPGGVSPALRSADGNRWRFVP